MNIPEPAAVYMVNPRLWGYEVVRLGNNLDTVIATYGEKVVAEHIARTLNGAANMEVGER